MGAYPGSKCDTQPSGRGLRSGFVNDDCIAREMFYGERTETNLCYMGEHYRRNARIIAVRVILLRAEILPKNRQRSSGRDSGGGFSPGALSVSPQKTRGINVDP